MNTVTTIEFVFENCECFEIESKHFGMFQMSNIQTKIMRIACNAINKFQTAHSIALEIFSEANIDYNPFGSVEVNKKFDRLLAWRDITSIILHYDDNSEESYYVDYNEEYEGALGAENLNQHTYKSKLGNLYIVIEKDKNIDDYFDSQEIESEESMNFSKTMICD